MIAMRDRRRGSGLALTLFGTVALLGVGALALDFSRVFVARNELQTSADAMALAAARHLDGSPTAEHQAESAARRMQGRWHFGSEVIPEPVFEYSASGGADSWQPRATAKSKYVRVRIEAHLAMSLGRIFATESLTPAGDMVLGTMAVALRSQRTQTELSVLPIAVEAPEGAWPEGAGVAIAPGQSGRGSCESEFGPARLFVPDDPRLPGNFAALAVREWALREGVRVPRQDVEFTEWLARIPERVAVRMLAEQDSDGTSGVFADYARLGVGSGKRLVRVVATRAGSPLQAITVLLPPLAAMTDGPICGEYVSAERLAASPWKLARASGGSVRLVTDQKRD